MKNIRIFLSKNYQFLEVKFSIYLNSFVFVMFFLRARRLISLVDFPPSPHLDAYAGFVCGILPFYYV